LHPMGAQQPSLQQRDHPMHARQQLRRGLLLPAQKRDLMNVATLLQRLVSQPSVGMDHAARFDRLFHKANQTAGRSVHNPPPLAVFLGRRHNQLLVRGLPTANTLFQPAQVGFVHFHNFPRVVLAPVSPWPDAVCGASPKRFCSCPSPKHAAIPKR